MGVPKFFRYISERYPCLSEIVKEYQIPEFDNLYLDMNGIIHMCSHPDDGDPHFRISEEKIFQDIFHYIEVLFRMIKPRKLFFMAVDGVAPRAKMNQQRARRFRSAKDAEKLEEKARKKGEVLPTEARFDSNCITPGTVFMANLQEQLKYFVVNKVSTDRLWRKCKVILSGHETPGEGEHKIMDYIRYIRAQSGYDPNTRHCLYGLDADLIMLGLCTHEPHFSLLREEVKFGKKSTKRKSCPEEITFYLLHLSLMREYLELEFDSIRKEGVLKFGFDVEKVIDDWVLMGFLVGNDFIPHLPNLHITNGALPILYKKYMETLPVLDGYINESGTLNLGRFEKFMEALSSIDLDNFEEQYTDLKYFEAKTGRRPNGTQRKSYKFADSEGKLEDTETGNGNDLILFDSPEEEEKPKNTELAALVKKTEDMFLEPSETNLEKLEIEHDSDPDSPYISDEDSDGEDKLRDDDMFHAEFKQHKTDYYTNKLAYLDVTSEVLKSQAEGYVRAIQWNLHYYYNGVCSWSWFYPHHYAPYASDIKGFSDLKLEFDLCKPFQPYEQLLAVLPAASRSLLPTPYHHLMTEETSLIKEYYPEEFQTDLNGKRAEWEAVVLIPFIDEKVLLEAMEPCAKILTPEEVKRNTHGPMLIYTYTLEHLGQYEAPEYFPPVSTNHASCMPLTIEAIRIPQEKLVKGAYPGVKMDVYYPGFPTLKHLKYSHVLEKAGVKVHEHPSRGENVILKIEKKGNEEDFAADAVARKLLGTTIYVAWPHLVEALVVSVSDSSFLYHSSTGQGHYNVEANKGNLQQTWQLEKNSIVNFYMSRFGVQVGPTDILVHVKVMIGRKYIFTSQGRVTMEKEWAPIASAYPLQSIVQNISVHDEKFTVFRDVESVFEIGSVCFMLGHPYYGSMGEVKDSKESLKKGRIKVNMKAYEEPELDYIREYCEEVKVRYMDLHAASTKLAISRSLFTRITGSIFVSMGTRKNSSDDTNKVNIGLNLKFSKKNEEVPGYTHRKEGVWLYAEKAVNLVRAYNEFCPKLFEYVNSHNDNVYFVDELFPDQDGKEKIEEIISWIKMQPFYSIERRACGSLVLDPEVVAKLEEFIDNHEKNKVSKDVVMQVKPHLLYKPDLNIGNIAPDQAATYNLYDRVVNIRECYTVPLGLRGTVIAIHNSSLDKGEPLYDVLFDEPFAGGLMFNCSTNRVYRLPKVALINKSYGQRQLEKKAGKTGQIMQKLQTSMQQSTNVFNDFANQVLQNPQLAPPSSAFATWANQPSPQRPVLPAPNINFINPARNYNMYNNQFIVNDFKSSNFNMPIPLNVLQNSQILPQERLMNFIPHFAKPELQQNPAKNDQQLNIYSKSTKPAVRPQKPPFDSKPPVLKPPAQDKNGRPVENWRQTQENWRRQPVDRNKMERPKVDTDFLKKVLKIEPKKSTPEPPKTELSDVKLTVQDIFTHAEDKTARIPEPQSPQEPKSTYSSVQLLSYYQTNGLGCPHYCYVDLPDKTIQAQLISPINGQIVFGKPSSNKPEACDNVASEMFKILSQTNKNELFNNVPATPPWNIPCPPRTWWNKQMPNPPVNSQSSSRSSTSTGKPNPNNKQNHPNRASASSANTTQFVPLQAVRQHVSKGSSNTSKKDSSSKENDSVKTELSTFVKEINTGNASHVKPSGGEEKAQKRRERKMRIAANFQVKLEN